MCCISVYWGIKTLISKLNIVGEYFIFTCAWNSGVKATLMVTKV